MIVVSGAYLVKEGKRDEFVQKIIDQGIRDKNQSEAGNIAYDYYYPVGKDDAVYFIETWESREAWDAHKEAPHVTGQLKDLKDEYLTGFEPGLLGELIEQK
jgi:quinol monooxygenase YgiN